MVAAVERGLKDCIMTLATISGRIGCSLTIAMTIAACGGGGTPANMAVDMGTGGMDAKGGAGSGMGGSSSKAGGGNTGGGSTGGASGGTGTNIGVGGAQVVECKEDGKLPDTAPALEVGVWKDIGPKPWDKTICATGFAIGPCNPAVLFLGTDGIYRSTDAGTSWAKVGKIKRDAEMGFMDGSNHIRINPNDPKHVYAVSGVRGAFLGFWVSHDGGDTFEMTDSYRKLQADKGIFPIDVYDIAVNPKNFNHFLLTSHSPWGTPETQWKNNAGVLESQDGGMSWIIHPPQGWGYGHAISFLWNPELGIGDEKRWLLSTQDNGRWLTKDSGTTWTKVSDNPIQHGGGTVYYSKSKVLYASGQGRNIRSKDNGETWEDLSTMFGSNAIYGDGTQVYSAPVFGPAPFYTTPEDGPGDTWTPFSDQMFDQGPFQMILDKKNRILYSASCISGLWALKLPPL